MKIAVAGAAGRTGRHIVGAVIADPRTELSGAIERADYPLLGQDAGVVAGVGTIGVSMTADLLQALEHAEVLVDFSIPQAIVVSSETAAAAGVAMVVGTTGMDSAALDALSYLARSVPVVASPNMSVGVNVVLQLLEKAAHMLGSTYDFEVFEMHHRSKVDAPSGTALRMAEVVARLRGVDVGLSARHGRSGALGPRSDEEIGIHAARGGDVIGDHVAIFAGPGERVEVVHRAHGRDTFALGAVRAALWTAHRPPGLYDMNDVLNQGDA